MKSLKSMMIKCSLVIMLITTTLISSCKKTEWYDIKTDKTLSTPATLKDMQALMDNGSIMNTGTPGMGEVASDGHYVNSTVATNLTGYHLNAYTWSQEVPYEVVRDWAQGNISTSSYTRIYYSNVVLDGLPKIKTTVIKDQEIWNDLKGQALFHRSHAFYELAQVFAPAFEASKAANQLGIPLRLTSDIDQISKRATLRQTYDQIINDLLLAKNLLPQTSQYKTRPSKLAVHALLARIYLSMEDYINAKVYADTLLNGYSELMNYSTLNYSNSNNPIPVYNKEMVFYSVMMDYMPIQMDNVNLLIDRPLYDSYSDNDLRKKVFYNENSSSKIVTYKGTYAGQGYAFCFSGLATDEVYLIRAECLARTGKVTEAMSDLNALIKTRWLGAYTDMTAIDSEDALKKVLAERKKELVLRGIRWSDLRRLNRDPKFAVTFTRTVGNKAYTLEPNSYKYTFPIPDDIIRITGMAQNPGWK